MKWVIQPALRPLSLRKKNYQWLDNLGVMKQTWEMGPEKIIYIIYKNKIYNF